MGGVPHILPLPRDNEPQAKLYHALLERHQFSRYATVLVKTTRAYTRATIPLLCAVPLVAPTTLSAVPNFLLMYRQPQTLQRSFALRKFHSGEFHKQNFTIVVHSVGDSHTWATLALHVDASPHKQPPPSNHLPLRANCIQVGSYIQHSPSWNIRLDGTPTQILCNDMCNEGSRAPQLGVLQSASTWCVKDINCNIRYITTAAGT